MVLDQVEPPQNASFFGTWPKAKDGESITASPCDFQDFEAETGRDLIENGWDARNGKGGNPIG
jgi:hypothetical protein